MSKILKQKMYSLVLRQLNPIQKGIQTSHAIIEYANLYSDYDEYKRWSKEDKTLIMLDIKGIPHMKETIQKLISGGIKFAVFCEPDLDGLPTAMCFLADERVWDKYWHNDNHILPCYDSLMMFGEPLPSDEESKQTSVLKNILENLHTSR